MNFHLCCHQPPPTTVDQLAVVAFSTTWSTLCCQVLGACDSSMQKKPMQQYKNSDLVMTIYGYVYVFYDIYLAQFIFIREQELGKTCRSCKQAQNGGFSSTFEIFCEYMANTGNNVIHGARNNKIASLPILVSLYGLNAWSQQIKFLRRPIESRHPTVATMMPIVIFHITKILV